MTGHCRAIPTCRLLIRKDHRFKAGDTDPAVAGLNDKGDDNSPAPYVNTSHNESILQKGEEGKLTVSETSWYVNNGPATLRITQLVPEFTETISIDIQWGSLEFVYYEGGLLWDDENHEWVPDENGRQAGWSPARADSNKITVKNNSNVAISAALSYAGNAEFSSTVGTFTDGENEVTAPIALGAFGWNDIVWFELSGTVNNKPADYVDVGIITVTIFY